MSVVAPICLFVVLCILNWQRALGAKDDLQKKVAAGMRPKSTRRTAFSLEKEAKQACKSSVIITAPSGTIISPGFTNRCRHLRKVNCVWIIRAPPNKVLRMVVRFADIRCPDALELYNYKKGDRPGYHIGTVCGRKVINMKSTNDAAIYMDTNGAYVTFRSHGGRRWGRGFCICYTVIDPDERPCGVPRIKPAVPGMRDNDGGVLHNPAHFMARIIGGKKTMPFSWPWQASVTFYGIHMCGGALIDNRWVVTAAHCLGQSWEPADVTVILGTYNTSKTEDEEPTQQLFGMTDWFIHPDYDEATYDNDIALMRLKEDFRYSPQVSPVCLPTEDVDPGKMCVATGWGTNMVTFPDVLNQVKLAIVDHRVCSQRSWYGKRITNGMVCAGYPEGGKDTCSGDSGGPLVCKYGQHWVLHGITSWSKGYGCGEPNTPGVYTRVRTYLKWIARVMSSN